MRNRHIGRVLAPSALAAVALVGVATVNYAAASDDPNQTVLPDGNTVTSSAETTAVRPLTGPLAKTPAGKAAIAQASGSADDETPVTTVSTEDAVYYSPKTGKVAFTRHYGPKSEGRKLRVPKRLAGHGTGGVSSASGCVKVTITVSSTTLLGNTVYTFRSWSDWCWTRSNQVVNVNDKDTSFSTDSAWSYDGIVARHNGYYDYDVNDGHPKSAYKHDVQAAFSGPAIAIHTAHEYPEIDLRSYYNGTNQWWTSV